MAEGRMERDPDVLVAEVEGRPLLLNVRTWTYLSFNETGARIWHHLEEPRGRAELLERLTGEFEAPEAEIAADLDLFLAELREQGFLLDAQ
jgi:hypothetical protein